MFGSRVAIVLALLTAPAPEPRPIGVPAALQLRSATLEASGLVWAPTLARYLVVSDDTGSARDHHQPWLLAMSREGVFDPDPLPIGGIDELNDAESICAGPDGTFLLATSHSPNHKGNTPPARRMLLQLVLDKRALRVVGRVDLTTARDNAGHTLLEIAGVPRNGRLDIEAITFRDGALLIGLKSPLSARNGAVILRLAAPVAALRAGRIPDGSLTRLWELSLLTPDQIPQGIADMTSLPDGSMALVANAPKGGQRDGGGALYWFHPKTNAVKLLRQFDRLRPEGIALAADGQSLAVVFDTDDQAPLWMRWPLPGETAAR